MILAAKDLTRTVADRVLWRDFGFALHAGESVAVTGPSGSGKTLLLRTLAGLDPIESGQVYFRDRAQDAWSMPLYRAGVVYLSQRPALLPGTVRENLERAFALKVHQTKRFDPARARALLETLDRPASFEKQSAPELSGGEAQVMALVRALLLEPHVLLLDEATASLDPATTLLAEGLVARWLKEEPERGCLWVSHDPAQRERVASREVALKGGARA